LYSRDSHEPPPGSIFASNISGWRIAMKRLLIGISAAASLLATGALAADLPMKAPVYKAPEVVYDWTGFYVGGNVGYSWGNAANTTTVDRFLTGLPLPGALVATNTIGNDVNGIIGGGQIGYNWQLHGGWLVGLEADFQGSGEKGSSSVNCVACSDDGTNITTTLNQKLDWFGTVRGRIGVLPSPDALLYLTGGLAYGKFDVNGNAVGNINLTNVVLPGASSTKAGWTAGVGFETRIVGNWTWKLEYLYMDLGSVGAGPVPLTGILVPVRTVAGLSYASHFTDNILRAGINYKFGGPVVAKY
jgi:outer membrane immunogenic protein